MTKIILFFLLFYCIPAIICWFSLKALPKNNKESDAFYFFWSAAWPVLLLATLILSVLISWDARKEKNNGQG